MRPIAGRRLRDSPGPDGAPRGDGTDVRWTDDYAYITTRLPDAKPYLWGLLGATHDQGSRAGPGAPNPFWGEEPADVPGLQPSPSVRAAVARVRRRHLRRLLQVAARRRSGTPGTDRVSEHASPLGSDTGSAVHLPQPNPRSLTMPDALTVLPWKVRAGIYVLLVTASAVLTPLMAAGTLPSLYGAIVQSLLGVFGGAVALSNLTKPATSAAAVVETYDAKHDAPEAP